MFKPASNFRADRSKAVHLFWILFAICVSCLSVKQSCLASVMFSCVFANFQKIYSPGSGVLFGCIDLCLLPSFYNYIF